MNNINLSTLKSILQNRILMVDSYKLTHYRQYPQNMEKIIFYFESRGGDFKNVLWSGLQYFIVQNFLNNPITMEEVEEAQEFATKHMGYEDYFPYEGWKYIATELKGKLPIRIKAVREGALIPGHNILLRIESTDPKVAWIAGWFETMLVRLWDAPTVGTYSYYCRLQFIDFLKKTCEEDSIAGTLAFMLHDFGGRGVSSAESAMIGGAAHLINFLGSDTIEGVRMANKIYQHDMSAFSVAAMEHSTVTTWGRAREFEAYTHFLDQFLHKAPDGAPMRICAAVSDSYNVWNAIQNYWCRQDIMDRIKNSGCRVVIRLDSGDPITTVVKALKMLDACGYTATTNSKGYKVLPDCIRILQGDGININSIKEILYAVEQEGYSVENVVFGMGGALLQQHNRDTLKFALKACYALLDEEWVHVYKDPIDDKGKKSKTGNLDLVIEDGVYKTVDRDSCAPSTLALPSELVTIFENGEMKAGWTLKEIRRRAWGHDPYASVLLAL